MRCWSIALSLLLVGCGGDPQGSTIRSISVQPDSLVMDLDLRFTDTQLEALDHGIPLQLAVDVDGASSAHVLIDLRYRPLSRQYELRLPGDAEARLYTSRSRLLAALDRVLVATTTGPSGSARVSLVSSALPAPLRLPALIDDDWQLQTPTMRWGG